MKPKPKKFKKRADKVEKAFRKFEKQRMEKIKDRNKKRDTILFLQEGW